MHNKKQTEQMLAVSLFVGAGSLVALLIAICGQKKSLSRALATIAMLEGTLGAFLLWRQRFEERRAACPKFTFDGPDAELFNADEADNVEDQVNTVLSGHDSLDSEPDAQPLFTIPVDEETTEADFLK